MTTFTHYFILITIDIAIAKTSNKENNEVP